MNLISQAKTWLSVKNTSWETVLYTFMSSLKDTHCLAKGVDAKSAEEEVQSVMITSLESDIILLIILKEKWICSHLMKIMMRKCPD